MHLSMYLSIASCLVLGLASGGAISGNVVKRAASSCRYLPGDAEWPTRDAWDRLNSTVSGRLLATVPIAHVCHSPDFSQAACSNITERWDLPGLMSPEPAEILSIWFQNQSCTPFTNISTPCELGNYASYSINVSHSDHIIAGLAFAQEKNIRVVIKNTGHDFFGKSTGKGALSLWTRHLKSQEVILNYQSALYAGPAIKFGAGITGGEAAQFAAKHGYRVVVGSCATVGLVGGFAQGGGHSFLSGLYGFAADNVLEWEVVTAAGEHIIATPEQNTDLYWALSGGGGGTYGVVISMTARVFPDGKIALASLSFDSVTASGQDRYWKSVHVFLQQLQPLVDNHGIVAEFIITNDTLTLFGMMAPGYGRHGLTTLLRPMMRALKRTAPGITEEAVRFSTSDSMSYSKLYSKTVEPLTMNETFPPAVGGRFVSRANMASNTSAIIDSLRATTYGGKFIVAATALNVNGSGREVAPVADNAVEPAFHRAFMSLIVSAAWTPGRPWAEAIMLQDELTNVIIPTLEAATPGTGAYINEANWQQPDWQNTFYGNNYQSLRAIKAKYDPNHLFYGLTAVGSEAWAPDASGRLCKTGL
ncbi:uncharacterized protein GIQ15_00208 [Arthroderma uncinatum]|uniref:uncharacterized protein n=1 Tax=Arthroderma uncinatum TaxID=74035 RepID=UPI00144A95C4|nr:uncharacterized protein GIQ15_00208 [Arthroderma uncinatum]KAF3490691.1 hypothetical protein GIQ15_00208 [Arthroderma uncinatum]